MIDQRIQQQDILDKLIRAHGLKRFALFFVTGEGIEMPDGLEESSGFVLDASGRVYFFYLSWDTSHEKPVFTDWNEVKTEAHWVGVAEYQRAREAVGLVC